MKRDSAKELIAELRKTYNYMDIAFHLGRCYNTVYSWRDGKKCPSRGDMMMMRSMLKKDEISLDKPAEV